MTHKRTAPAAEQAVIDRGIEVLIKELGRPETLKFILAIERGSGDSVEEFKELWGNKTAREIHQEIMAAKEWRLI